MNRTFALLIAGIGLLSASAIPASAQHGHGSGGTAPDGTMQSMAGEAAVEGQGVINSVDRDARSVNLSHEPIAAIGWPSMTMDMKVADGVDLTAVEDGAPVTFTLERGADGIYMIKDLEAAR